MFVKLNNLLRLFCVSLSTPPLATPCFPAKWRLWNERRYSILMARRVLLISNNRDDRMRAYCLKQSHPKSLDQNLTPKNRTPNFQAIKISRGTKHPGYEGTITNLQIVLNTQKNCCVNQATQKNTCQNFPEQKIPKSKISNAKNSFDHSCRLKYGVNPSPPPWDWWRDITQIRVVPLSGRTAWEICFNQSEALLRSG